MTIAEMRARIEKAHAKVKALCQGDERWIMRVPADRERDPDLVITDGLMAGEEALAMLDKLVDGAIENEIKKMATG